VTVTNPFLGEYSVMQIPQERINTAKEMEPEPKTKTVEV
jgi:hypothetical protein